MLLTLTQFPKKTITLGSFFVKYLKYWMCFTASKVNSPEWNCNVTVSQTLNEPNPCPMTLPCYCNVLPYSCHVFAMLLTVCLVFALQGK